MRAAGVLSLLALACSSTTTPLGRAELSLPAMEAARSAPGEELRSYAPANTTIFGRFELARMRRSQNASVYSDAVRRFYTFRSLLDETGWDPVRDLDQALVAAPHLWNPDAIVVLRTRESTDEVRERLRRTWAARGSSLTCSHMEDFEICAWPSRSDRQQAVLFAAEHEVVISEPQHMPELVRIAINQRAHRTRGEVVEPMLTSPQEPLARIRETAPPWFFEPSPAVADLVAYELGTGRLSVTLDAKFHTEEDARAAEIATRDYLTVYLREPMLSGVAHLLAALRVRREADHVVVSGDFDHADIISALVIARLLGG
jgi:hypothetical protein